jgi:hypothetical protein
MKIIRDIAWCVSTMVLICIVTICLLLLGVCLGEGVKPTPKEQVTTCVPSGRGFYKCTKEFI